MKNTLSIIILFTTFLIVNNNINAQHLSKDDFTNEPTYITPKTTTISSSNIPPVEECYCYYYNDFNDYQLFISQYLLFETASIRNQWYEEQKKVISDELIVRLSLDPNYAHNYSYDYLQTSFFADNFAVPIANQFLNQAKNSSASARNRNLEDFNKTHIPTKIFQYAQSNSSYDFGDLVHYNKPLEDITYNEAYTLWNQYGTQNASHEQNWHYNSARVNKINKMLSHVPVLNPSSEYVNFTTHIANKFKNHVNSQSLSNQVSLMTGYMIYEWQLQYLYTIPNQILSGTDYDFYYPYNDSSQISTAMNNYISNSSGNSDSFNYPSNDPDYIKRQYSMTKYNLGNLVGNFYEGKDALIEEGGKYQERDGYNSTTRNMLKNLAEYFIDDERIVPDNYWDGVQAWGQNSDRPEQLMNVQLSTTALNAGFRDFGRVLEALGNYPQFNSQKGDLIRHFIEVNSPSNVNLYSFTSSDLGKIFDFDYRGINNFGLKFSDYAMSLILEIEHEDNIYGWDLFRDTGKKYILKALANGNLVDFSLVNQIENFIINLGITDVNQIKMLYENFTYFLKLNDYLILKENSHEAKVDVKEEISSMTSNANNANPIFSADCRSFEYAQPAGQTVKACAVKDLGQTFYSARIYPNGSWVYNEIEISYDKIYFKMPTWKTNSQAANDTAIAVTAAFRATGAYIIANPKVSKEKLGEVFEDALRTSLALYGGSFTNTAPFFINSPAPFISSIGGPETDC